ncbi:hypothetical protein CA606_10665 [Caulobacter vibrioides]|uniref:Uncharacterized protein n=1 Tax=Caulobacter vibrioides TaxID=155892 RepID=A0A290MUX5_CAUVI|nr:hypothetical protein [Caulobacter vibrioides]ATC32768.1 hypothetical protein CA606_10665 [Caulobacter vibrioides]
MAEPTLRDFQFLIQLVDAGLIQASFKFGELRVLFKTLGVLTPEVDAALAIVEANPTLINIGVQTFKDAISKYPLDTPLSVVFGGSTGGSTGGTGTVVTPLVLTKEKVEEIYKALSGISATSSKALSEYLTGPNGEKVLNTLYSEMKLLAQLQVDVAAGKITKAAFLDKLVSFSADTSALALQAVNFFTGRTPSQASLNELIDSAANTADLTDFAYAIYNTENKYIEFAVSQAMSGTGAATFKTAYDALGFREAVTKMYDAIIGNSKAAAAGVNISAAIDYIVGQQKYFEAYGHTALGAKAAVAGFLMSKGLEAGVGVYAEAVKAFLGKAYDGTAVYGGDLVGPAKAPMEIALIGQAPEHYDPGMPF